MVQGPRHWSALQHHHRSAIPHLTLNMHLRLACLLEALLAHDQIRKVSDHCVAACCFVALLVAATVRFKRFKHLCRHRKWYVA